MDSPSVTPDWLDAPALTVPAKYTIAPIMLRKSMPLYTTDTTFISE